MREDPFRVLPLRFYGGAMGNMRAAGRRPRRRLLPQGACPAGCAPHFLFRLAEKKTGRTRKGYAASVSGKAANGCAAATRSPGGRGGLYQRTDEGIRPYEIPLDFRTP